MIQLEFPLVLALIVVGWLTAGGTAVRSVSRIWLRLWAERRLLVAASAGVAITLLFAGVRLGIATSGPLLALRLVVYGGVMVLVGQMIPRAIARRWASSLTPLVLPILRAAEILAAPVVSLGRFTARPLEKRREMTSKERDREAIQDLLREGELEGVGQRDEIAIISGVVEFGEKHVREVMTPRADIFALEDTVDPHTLAEHIAQSAYSRVPLYRNSIDNIVGMVHAFDVLKAGGEGIPPLRPVAVTTDDTPANELLFRMLRERLHLAIVRDDAQHTVGLVSLEDLLEELVGDIRDEHDEPEPPRAEGAR